VKITIQDDYGKVISTVEIPKPETNSLVVIKAIYDFAKFRNREITLMQAKSIFDQFVIPAIES
jgi:hypothetical protein